MGRYARNSIGQYAPVGAAADDLPGGATPTGKKTIDTTAEVDVASYATAQVVDENLTAENIKKDVEVLGITGEFEGGGGGDFSAAAVEFINISTDDPYYLVVLPHLESGVVVLTDVEVPANDSITVSIPIGANGMIYALGYVESADAGTTPTSTGGVSINLTKLKATITGDGTFTAKGKAT